MQPVRRRVGGIGEQYRSFAELLVAVSKEEELTHTGDRLQSLFIGSVRPSRNSSVMPVSRLQHPYNSKLLLKRTGSVMMRLTRRSFEMLQLLLPSNTPRRKKICGPFWYYCRERWLRTQEGESGSATKTSLTGACLVMLVYFLRNNCRPLYSSSMRLRGRNSVMPGSRLQGL